MLASLPPAGRTRFIGIFIIALAVVAYQVVLTRIFSVALYYHFAFAGISLAMLGITIGAEHVYLSPRRFTQEHFEEEWAKAAIRFAVSSVLLVLLFLWIPLFVPPVLTVTMLGAGMLLFVIPFAYSGICVTLILTRSLSVGKLYAADLTGAATGCIAIVLLLFYLDPISIVFLLAALACFSAWGMVRGVHGALSRKAARYALVMLAAGLLQGTLYVTGHAHIGILWSKNGWEGSLLYERWNAFSRVRVLDYPSRVPFGWGYGHPQSAVVDQHYLDIDSDAGTVITRFNGDLKPFSFLANDVINAGYHVRSVNSVAIIGVGGGRDVMSALYFGAKEIIALELNPAIVEAVRTTFAGFTGHFAARPEVKLVNAEARSWLAQHHPQVDLVQISLIDTWAATAAGGLTLSENRLYTLDAWKEFLSTLTPKGMLAVSRWYNGASYRGEFYRLLSLAVGSLESVGTPAKDVREHILAFNEGQIVTVVISKTAFTSAEVAHARDMAKEQGFALLVTPDDALDETSRVIASGEATPAYYNSLARDVTAPTDNRPFFFFMTRMSDALKQSPLTVYDAMNGRVIGIVFLMLIGTLVVTFFFIIRPLLRVLGSIPLKPVLSDLLYFGGIGIGFMLIEISQMQRLIVFLGHPVYGLCVVLFTLLLFGGLGSATVHPFVRAERLWKRPLLLCLVLVATGMLTPIFATQFAVFSTPARIFVSVILLAPAGFCMGMKYPAGMLLSSGHRELQPWFWGINGATSVFASILGMAISMVYGISDAYWTGVAAYAICLMLVFIHRKRVIA